MYLITLTLFLHIIFGCLTRMVQNQTPFHVSLVKFNKYPSPSVLLSFGLIRAIFVCVCMYNSAVLSFFFRREVLIPYVIWYILLVSWIHSFTQCNFHVAWKIMVCLTLCAVIMCIEMPIFMPNSIWCIYLLYISSWYKWCLPI